MKKDVKCSSLIIFNALTLKYFRYIQLNKIYLSIKFNFYLPLQKHICDLYILAFYFFNLTKLTRSTGSFASFLCVVFFFPPCFMRAFSTVSNEMMSGLPCRVPALSIHCVVIEYNVFLKYPVLDLGSSIFLPNLLRIFILSDSSVLSNEFSCVY